MTLAFWCVFLLAFLPWSIAMYSKRKSGYTFEDNKNARDFYAKSTGMVARANAAQLNSYEIFPVFAAVVFIAHATNNASQTIIDVLAILFVLSRVMFCLAYLMDKAIARSIIFIIGIVFIVTLFLTAI